MYNTYLLPVSRTPACIACIYPICIPYQLFNLSALSAFSFLILLYLISSFISYHHLAICLSIHPSLHPSICRLIHLSIDPSMYPSVYSSIHPSIYLSFHLTILLSICQSIKNFGRISSVGALLDRQIVANNSDMQPQTCNNAFPRNQMESPKMPSVPPHPTFPKFSLQRWKEIRAWSTSHR